MRPIRTIVPGRQVDIHRGGLDPDIENLYDLLETLEAAAAQIGDVDLPLSGATEDDLLIFLSGAWTTIDKTDLLALDDLTDVSITSPASADVLRYNGTEWVNSSLAETLALDDLSDVVISGAADGQILTHNGTNWLNRDWTSQALGIGVSGSPHSRLQVGGAVATAYSAKTGDYTVLATDGTFDVDATSAAVTLTLPTAVGISGREYTVKKTDDTVHPVIVVGTGGQTIDEAASLYLRQEHESRTVRSNGASWGVVKAFIPKPATAGVRSLLAFWMGGA